ncbi:MAG: hypothetical protein WDN23_00315 [Edaphobacter sp.]
MERYSRLCYLYSSVRSEAESAIRVGKILVRVNVDSLNRAADKDQSNTKQGEQKPPATVQHGF